MKKNWLALTLVILLALTGIGGTAENAPSSLQSAYDDVVDSLGTLFSEVGTRAKDTADEVVGAVKSLFSDVDLYFENGVIYTADANDTIVEALAVKDGLIVFVGSAEEGQEYKKSAAYVIDLQGYMLMPGLIDGHIHSTSPSFFDFSLLGITSIEKTMQTIQEYVQANPDKETYFGFGYMAPLFEGDELVYGPRKERLDEICPDKPVVIYSYDGHGAWLNSKAFEYCGISKDTESNPGGTIVKDDDGELWGILQDTAMSFTANMPMDEQKVAEGLKAFTKDLNAMGYTSIMTPPGNGFLPVPWSAYQKMVAEETLTLRVRGAGLVASWQPEKDLAALNQFKQTYSNDLFSVVGAKFFVDGVVDNQSAYLLAPYANDSTNVGATGWDPDALNQAVTTVNEMGLLAHIHAMGDAGVRMALDATEYAQEKLGKGDYRNALTHLQLVAQEDFQRFAQSGVIAVANPYWHIKAPVHWEEVEHAFLGERAETEYPMKSFLDNGVVLAFASDYPVTVMPNPFIAIQTGVTRNLSEKTELNLPKITDIDDPTYLLWPEERLTVTQMLRGFTIDGAYAIFAENTTGSLEVGKSADMIVIDRNLFQTDPLSIAETKVLGTFLKGELVFFAE